MDSRNKRKSESQDDPSRDKRTKTKKQWRVPKKGIVTQPKTIVPGDSGIWVTCDKGREGKCTSELRDLFGEYAQEIYGLGDDRAANEDHAIAEDGEALDIESEIKAEVSNIRKPSSQQLFTPMRIEVQCVLFIKTVPPVEPVSFVERICADALRNPQRKRSRFARRLSPMTLIGRATEEGLGKIAKDVLAPVFHTEPISPRSFAIRPNIRNHNILSRDSVIKRVASIVGPGHRVDLQNYDFLIIIEIYQNICGMSVVGKGFERLKRFNLAEIYSPTPKENPVEVLSGDGQTTKNADLTT